MISYEYNHRNPLNAKDRPFSENAKKLTQLLPEQERNSIFLTAGQNLTENLKVFTTAYYNKRDSVRFDTSNPGKPEQITNSGTTQYGATLGAGLDLGNNWYGELVGSYNRNDFVFKLRELTESESESRVASRASEVLSVDAKVDGVLFDMKGGDVKLAVGGHFRQNKLRQKAVELGTVSAGFPFGDDLDRNVYALFGEVYLPLIGKENQMLGVERLEVSISGRYEKYNDFGSSTDPKFGVLWTPIDGLNLRATYGTSFRAPLLTEINESFDSNAAVLLNNISNDMSTTGTSLVILLSGNNADLQPESATTWTAGFDYQPTTIPNLNVGVTYFNINFKNKINNLTIANFNFLNDPKFTPVISPVNADLLARIANYQQINLTFIPSFGPLADFSDADLFLDRRLLNLSSIEVRGLDFSVSYGFDTENSGSWNFSVNGTYLLNFIEQISKAGSAFDVVSTRENPIDLRANGGISWENGGFTTNLTVNYVNDYLDTRADPEAKVDSWTTANLTISYNTEDRFDGWLADTSFTLSAVNLFDQNPPFITERFLSSGIFFDPSAASPAGRVLSFQITKQW